MALLLVSASFAQAQSPGQIAASQPQAEAGNCSVEGYVTVDKEGIPATVTLQNATDKNRTYATVNTDEYGHYTLKGYEPGIYVLNVTPTDCYGGWLSEKFTMKRGKISTLDVPVSFKKGKLSGNAMLDNAPLASCIVRLYNPKDMSTPVYETMTNSNGDYVFDDVVSVDSAVKPVQVSSEYKVIFTSDRFSPDWALPSTYTVKNDKTTIANAKITYPRGDLRGRVTTDNGTAIPYTSVKLFLANQTYHSPEIANTTTDMNGNYSFKKIIATPDTDASIWPRWWSPDFRYQVVAVMSNDTTQASPLLSIDQSANGTWDFRFPEASYKTGSIKGYLVTNTGYPIADETVNLMGKKGSGNCAIMSTKTGPDGYFCFDRAYASDALVKPGWWNGQYWLSYPTSKVDLFTLGEGDAIIKNATAIAQPHQVILTPERHYVRTDGQCNINVKIFDMWGNPYTKDAKIALEIANNETYGGSDIGALNSNDKIALSQAVTGGETNVTYGWAGPRFTGWKVTINGYPQTKQANPIVNNCTLTIIPSNQPYPAETIVDAKPLVNSTLPDDMPEPQVNESAGEETPAPTDQASAVVPTPASGTGSWIDQIWATIMSIFNWQ